jgi:hypothetical protein
MSPETKIQNLILMALSKAGCLVFRNETAGAWVGKVLHKDTSQVTLTDARMIRFGLAVGSSDIIGISPTGKFLALEVKTSKGRATKEQLRFIKAVNDAGGIAGICRSVEDALESISGG